MKNKIVMSGTYGTIDGQFKMSPEKSMKERWGSDKINRQIGDNAMFAISENYEEYMNLVRTYLPIQYVKDFYQAIENENLRNESIIGNIAYLYKTALFNDKLKKSLNYLDCYEQVAIQMIEDKNPFVALFNYVKGQIISKLIEKGDEYEHLLAWTKIIPMDINSNQPWAFYSFLDDEDFELYQENKLKFLDVVENNRKLFNFFEKHIANNIMK